MSSRTRIGRWLAIAAMAVVASASADQTALWPEVRRALTHSPLPPVPSDPTNPVQADPHAQQLGKALFFDARLSGSGTVSCASCHQPDRGWSDGHAVPVIGQPGALRRTPSIRNSAYQRWFNWDGSADSLWSQALGPIESEREMAGSRYAVARLVSEDVVLAQQLAVVFGQQGMQACHAGAKGPAGGEPVRRQATQCLRQVGMALAAYVATIVSAPNRFDAFVERVKAGAPVEAAGLSARELEGLRIFFGKGRCASCHTGPTFSNGEFHNLAIYPTVAGGWKDSGRLGGVRRLLASEFNVMKADLSPRQLEDLPTPYLRPLQAYWGQFKTPSLRNAAIQQRFMHHGQFASLEDVVNFYSEFDGLDTTDHHRELSIMPLRLSATERDSLAAFLRVIGE